MGEIVFIIILGVFILGIFLSFYSKFFRKKLTKKQIGFFLKKLDKIDEKTLVEQVLFCDILYHKILIELGYIGSFGDILKKKPNHIGDLNLVWKLHKVRNVLAHNENPYSEKDLEKKVQEYIQQIKELLKKSS